ncbi:MAG TPA: glycoside hydrolase family 25 protein, partial [Pseudolabrys sp.]|nr:glycoside hydrolase family 25 protein [Pseudolabrys sp.]
MTDINLAVVDMNHFDTVTDLVKAKNSGIKGLVHKATEGATFKDPNYDKVRTKAVAAGLLWGAYHFGTKAPVDAQVKNFIDTAKPDDKTLVALDFEPNVNSPANTMTLDQAREFLVAVAAKLGRKPVLYSGSLIKDSLGSHVDPFFGSHRLWLAEFNPEPTLPASWTKFWLWQYSGDGVGRDPKTVPGIPGNDKRQLDCNHYGGSADELAAEWA